MRILLILLMNSISLWGNSQDNISGREKELKNFGDSVSRIIDRKTDLKIIVDSNEVYDIKELNTRIGYIIDKTYWENGLLNKAVLIGYEGDSRTFYYSDNLMIKAVIRNKKGAIKEEYYYDKLDNENSEGFHRRVSLMYPHLEEYYKTLIIGRTYLKR